MAAGERERERNTPKRASRAVMSLYDSVPTLSLPYSVTNQGDKPTYSYMYTTKQFSHLLYTYPLPSTTAEHSFRHNTIYSYQPRGSAAPHARPPITTSARPDLPPRRTITACIKSVTVMTNYLLTKQKSDKKNELTHSPYLLTCLLIY